MKKVKIIYWSGTGSTERISEEIEQGAKSRIEGEGIIVERKHVSEALEEDILSGDIIAFGCPAMGVEEIESHEMAPYIEKVKEMLRSKPIALFGSYGWGEGEWMEEWEQTMESYGAKVVVDSYIVNENPEGDDIVKCREYGATLIERVLI
jgi:flavodoxin short chain